MFTNSVNCDLWTVNYARQHRTRSFSCEHKVEFTNFPQSRVFRKFPFTNSGRKTWLESRFLHWVAFFNNADWCQDWVVLNRRFSLIFLLLAHRKNGLKRTIYGYYVCLNFHLNLKFLPNKLASTVSQDFRVMLLSHAYESCFWSSHGYVCWITKSSSRVFRLSKIGECNLCTSKSNAAM